MYVQHAQRPQSRELVPSAVSASVLVLVLWAAIALIAWGIASGTTASGARQAVYAEPMQAASPAASPAMASAAPAQPAPAQPGQPGGSSQPAAAPAEGSTAQYVDRSFGFSLQYPAEWKAETLAPGDAPGVILGLPGTPVPGSLGGVEFPYSSHIDMSVIVTETGAANAAGWGETPAEILASMAVSTGREAAAAGEGTFFQATTADGLEVWGLTHTPADGTERMWVAAPTEQHIYLFFLTVGGAADDRGTVQEMFDAVIPSFTVTS